jgi:hypothetical protein
MTEHTNDAHANDNPVPEETMILAGTKWGPMVREFTDSDLFTKIVQMLAAASSRTVLTTESNPDITKVKLRFVRPLLTLVEQPKSLIVTHT